MPRQFILSITLGAFLCSLVSFSYAQELSLPLSRIAPSQLQSLSPANNAAILKGIKVHTDNPFHFEFVMGQKGAGPFNAFRDLSPSELRKEANKLIKYFLASLTIPEKDLWVNLSPYEKNRIVPDAFGQTEMGRDLLAQDYILKQITASLMNPEGEVGKEFWKKIYAEGAKRGISNVPVSTFNKVWIVPDKAVVYENTKAGTAYVVESKLKVLTEEDYLAVKSNQRQPGDMTLVVSPSRLPSKKVLNVKATQGNNGTPNGQVSKIIRELIIPVLIREINEGQHFAQLRQVYNSLILATWYKKKLKNSILNQVYSEKNKISGVDYQKEAGPFNAFGDLSPSVGHIYHQYLTAFKKGAYNLIKEEQDPMTKKIIPRKYFSGGVVFSRVLDEAMIISSRVPAVDKAAIIDVAMTTVDTTWDFLRDQGYTYTIKKVKGRKGVPVTLKIVLKWNGQDLDDRFQKIIFEVFPQQKIAHLYWFYPNLPEPRSDAEKNGKGRALLRQLFNDQHLGIAGYTLITRTATDGKFKKSLEKMLELNPQFRLVKGMPETTAILEQMPYDSPVRAVLAHIFDIGNYWGEIPNAAMVSVEKKESVAEHDQYIARAMADKIKSNNAAGENSVFIMATGGTYEGVYKAFVAIIEKEKFDMSRFISFNLDEYYLGPKETEEWAKDKGSYRQFMYAHLFRHLVKYGWRQENAHFFNGNAKDIRVEIERYEGLIKKNGPIQLALCGIGSDGHVAFNEPIIPWRKLTPENMMLFNEFYVRSSDDMQAIISSRLRRFYNAWFKEKLLGGINSYRKEGSKLTAADIQPLVEKLQLQTITFYVDELEQDVLERYEAFIAEQRLPFKIEFKDSNEIGRAHSRYIQLAIPTVIDNSRHFNDVLQMPLSALTLGVGNLLDAEEAIVAATGPKKAEAIKKSVQEPPSPEVSTSY